MVTGLVCLLSLSQSIVSIELENQTLRAGIKALADKSGQKLSVTKSLESLHITAFIKDQPIDSVMGAIASTFRAEWRTTADGQQLYQTEESSTRLKDFLKGEKTNRVRALQKSLNLLSNLLDAPDGPAGSMPGAANYKIYLKDPRFNAVAATLAVVGPGAASDLLGGRLLLASSLEGSGTITVPPTYWEDGAFPPEDLPISSVAIGLSDDDSGFRWMRHGKTNFGSVGSTNAVYGIIPKLETLPKSDFGKEVASWAKFIPSKEFPLVGAKPPEPSYTRGFSEASIYRHLHSNSGASFVSWGTRQVHSSAGFKSKNLREELLKLAAKNGSQFHQENDIICVRPREFRELPEMEPDEAKLRKLESIESPKLSDFAAFFAGHSDLQLKALSHRKLGSRKDFSWLQEARIAWVFLALLSPDQQELALAGKWVPSKSFDRKQREAFLRSMREIVFNPGFSLNDSIASFNRIEAQLGSGNTGFLMNLQGTSPGKPIEFFFGLINGTQIKYTSASPAS